MQPLIEVEDLVKTFPSKSAGQFVRAVNGVSFSINLGETLGLVGESGSGKSTVGRCLLRLVEPTTGAVRYRGQDLLGLSRSEFRELRPKLQMVFQDPYGSLDPRLRLEDTIREPLDIWDRSSRGDKRERVLELAAMVHLERTQLGRFPHQLSGGQLQRAGIARALAMHPEFLVLDEPTASLDLSIRSEILDLLRRLRAELDLSYLLISHDLTTVRSMSTYVAVMYLGRLVEVGWTDQVFRLPSHPYTRALLASVPLPDPDMPSLQDSLSGEIPSPIDVPPGCPLYSRCSYREDECARAMPPLQEVEPGHLSACYRADLFRPASSLPAGPIAAR